MARRRPTWLPLVAAALAMALFSTLGTWQLQRASEKQALFDAIEQGAQRRAIELPYAEEALAELEYRRVHARGHFLSPRQFLLDNRMLDGRVGYDVLAPLRLDDGRTVLVDRGWVPAGPQREPQGRVALDETGPLTVTGRLWRPQPGIALGRAVTESEGWPRTATRVDYAAFSEALGRTLVPAVIRAEGEQPWALTPRPLTPPFGPERHYGYAVQWFALALTVLVIAVVLTWRGRGKTTNGN
ncbi:MAG: SURF1 family protein [Halofilum sp. (in: g-proteobacteria)]